MGLFDIFIKRKYENEIENSNKLNDITEYADASSIDVDEKKYYKNDEYYTLFVKTCSTNPNKNVITFDERKKISYPSSNGLYVAEILLLDYCNKGDYPKPKNGYPGFWWFKYGIRDIGNALKSLEHRGFIEYTSKIESLKSLKTTELKEIACINNIKTNQNKEKLINDIKNNVNEIDIPEKYISSKYKLTELGKKELYENEYVVYMHKHKYKTNDYAPKELSFTVWDVNELLANKDKINWRSIVADLEEKRLGFRMADKVPDIDIQKQKNKDSNVYTNEEIISYLNKMMPEIREASKKRGDGLKEELEGLNYKDNGDDKKALYYLYIAIEKKFDAPALYRETAKILRKYKLYEEELKVIELGLINIGVANSHRKELSERRDKVKSLIEKKNKF